VTLYLHNHYVVSVWEISTGRCLQTIPVGGIVRSVSWCPNQALSLIAVAADRKVLLVNPRVGDHLVWSKTDSLLDEAPEQDVVGEV
jgi:ribosome biogenesis protein ERB1